MPKTYLLTGETSSGKTTNLKFWCKKTESVDGILSPVVNNERCLLHIQTGKMQEMETSSSDPSAQSVGKYHFKSEVFLWAQQILDEVLSNKVDWIIIDECGPLELQGNGFAPFLETLEPPFSSNILIVVRNNCIDAFIERFQSRLDSFKLITLSDLKYLG